MQSGNRLLDEREREREREVFVISVAESMSKKGQRNGINRKSCSEESLRQLCSDG